MDCVIFDLDGTIADIKHRRVYVEKKPKNWAAFNASMHMDEPNFPIIRLAQELARNSEIVICSGREAVYRPETETWLAKHLVPYKALYMRPEKDYRADDIVKAELLDRILADGWKPWLTVDDRNRVVAMWRSRGLPCLQCADGDF